MNELNLHDLVSSPDFKEEQINFIMTHHYGINNKPEYMEMIQTIKQRTPVLNSKNNGVELIVEFDEEEMYTDEKGIHSVEFPKVSFYDTFDATHLMLHISL